MTDLIHRYPIMTRRMTLGQRDMFAIGVGTCGLLESLPLAGDATRADLEFSQRLLVGLANFLPIRAPVPHRADERLLQYGFDLLCTKDSAVIITFPNGRGPR